MPDGDRSAPRDEGSAPPNPTLTADDVGPPIDPSLARRFRLVQLDGHDRGRAWESSTDRCGVGAHALNDLVIEDTTVSRFHCEIRITPAGPIVRDVGSHNGTLLDGVRIHEAVLRDGSVLRLGHVSVRFELGPDHNRLPASDRTELGGLVGRSLAMRQLFAWIECAAATDSTVLLEGETGTGKTACARAIHDASPRSGGPFVVVDCAALPGQLLDSELFGHEPGAFTGAVGRRIGVFEDARGGTVFLDELGDLPLELQPKLLRVLEERVVRRLGQNRPVPVDVRVLAASNRDLRGEVNAGRFRSDLYFRLAVLRVEVPPLRSRPEDLPLIAERILSSLGAADRAPALLTPDFVASLRGSAWPGNVRELRNHLERCLVLHAALGAPVVPPAGSSQPPAPSREAAAPVDARLPYGEARRLALEAFERSYALALLQLHEGHVATAATAAGIDKAYLHRLLRRHAAKR